MEYFYIKHQIELKLGVKYKEDEELRIIALEVAGNINTPDSHDLLVTIVSGESDILAERAKFIIEERRSEELL
jgi:hypothetical protein